MQIFNDPTYAWELLEWEIAIEMNDSLSGKAIAHLLELYMVRSFWALDWGREDELSYGCSWVLFQE